jgi:hypothetical protein
MTVRQARQSGDNSFTGGAYGHQFWGVGVYSRTNARRLAEEMVGEAVDQMELDPADAGFRS